MPEYVWMCLYKQDSKYTSGPKYPKSQNSEHGRDFNMQALHGVLSMPEYALTRFWVYLRF